MSETAATNQVKISALRREAERLEEDAIYSSKGHFNAEDTWVRRNYWLGVPATVLGAIAGATLIKSQPEWATAFTLLASLLTGLMTFLKPNERAAMHRTAAGQFLALRNEARFFREIELIQSDRVDELSERLKELSATRNELNLKSLSIPRRAFVAARKGIEEGEWVAIFAGIRIGETIHSKFKLQAWDPIVSLLASLLRARDVIFRHCPAQVEGICAPAVRLPHPRLIPRAHPRGRPFG